VRGSDFVTQGAPGPDPEPRTAVAAG
jgi:hypothetical protein